MPRKPPAKTHGAGSLYRRAADGRLTLKATVRAWDGSRRTVYLYGDAAPALRERLAQLRAEAAQPPLPPAPEPLTVQRYLRQWLTEARQQLQTSTAAVYAATLEQHVYPGLGAVLLADLTPQHLRDRWAVLTELGLAPGTVRNVRSIVHTALAAAVQEGLLPRNVVDLARAPRRPRFEAATLSAMEARTLIDGLAGDRLQPLVTVALHTGMRQGELLGLRWSDVDLDGAAVRVRVSLQVRPAFALKETKTRSGRRGIPLTERAVEALRLQRQLQREDRLRAGTSWVGRAVVFTTETGDYQRGSSVTTRLQRRLAQLALPRVRFHDLRHSLISILVAEGMPLPIVAAIAGHANSTLTLGLYSHAGAGTERLVRETLERVFRAEG